MRFEALICLDNAHDGKTIAVHRFRDHTCRYLPAVHRVLGNNLRELTNRDGTVGPFFLSPVLLFLHKTRTVAATFCLPLADSDLLPNSHGKLRHIGFGDVLENFHLCYVIILQLFQIQLQLGDDKSVFIFFR